MFSAQKNPISVSEIIEKKEEVDCYSTMNYKENRLRIKKKIRTLQIIGFLFLYVIIFNLSCFYMTVVAMQQLSNYRTYAVIDFFSGI